MLSSAWIKAKNSIYRLLDSLTLHRGIERLISGQKLRLPLRYWGFFELDYELANISFVKSVLRPGSNAIDIGAHIGIYSVVLSRAVGSTGRVIALEPTPSTYGLLTKTLELNHCQNVVALNKAASEFEGFANFYVTNVEAHNSNSLADTSRGPDERAIQVVISPVDILTEQQGLKSLDLLKVDAEGAELAVLKGSDRTLKHLRPAILLSLHPRAIQKFGDDLETIWHFLKERNYEIVFNYRPMSLKDFTAQTDLFDVYAFPSPS